MARNTRKQSAAARAAASNTTISDERTPPVASTSAPVAAHPLTYSTYNDEWNPSGIQYDALQGHHHHHDDDDADEDDDQVNPGALTTAPLPMSRHRSSRPTTRRRHRRIHFTETGTAPNDDEDEKIPLRSPEPIDPSDLLSNLSSELISLILNFLSPLEQPDLQSLSNLCLVSKTMVPHCRMSMYRHLTIEARTKAHALHRTLHHVPTTNKLVRSIMADINSLSKTSSQYPYWFFFHSMHSLCGIVASCRNVLRLTVFMPMAASAWTQSLFKSLMDLTHLRELTKDLKPSTERNRGAGYKEGMDIGWRPTTGSSLWSVSQLIKPLKSFKQLNTLRLCGLASDSSLSALSVPHSCRLTEVVLVDITITNTDLLHLLGQAHLVKKLTIWGSSILSKRGLTHVLRKTTSLNELKIGGSWFGAKDDDDANFPIDVAIPNLAQLKILHISGPLISPQVLMFESTNLIHLLVTNSNAWTPHATHSSLANMKVVTVGKQQQQQQHVNKNGGHHDVHEAYKSIVPPVVRLTLPDIKPGHVAGSVGSGSNRRQRDNVTTTTGEVGDMWDDKWIFGVRALCEAKGVLLETGADLNSNSETESDDE
ncbi:hypothetical protein OIO90_002813 [Microbotryomycetes sp. JL221]|nr:hypothetical protein OIO90_002813 [Microbotryomycetes sp. JL221]